MFHILEMSICICFTTMFLISQLVWSCKNYIHKNPPPGKNLYKSSENLVWRVTFFLISTKNLIFQTGERNQNKHNNKAMRSKTEIQTDIRRQKWPSSMHSYEFLTLTVRTDLVLLLLLLPLQILPPTRPQVLPLNFRQ
jgi:hypothetical protein